MKFWKALLALVGLDILFGGRILDGTKGGPGCGCVLIFIIIFFPLWLFIKLEIKLLKLIFSPIISIFRR